MRKAGKRERMGAERRLTHPSTTLVRQSSPQVGAGPSTLARGRKTQRGNGRRKGREEEQGVHRLHRFPECGGDKDDGGPPLSALGELGVLAVKFPERRMRTAGTEVKGSLPQIGNRQSEIGNSS
jgi:hypothetical protein